MEAMEAMSTSRLTAARAAHLWLLRCEMRKTRSGHSRTAAIGSDTHSLAKISDSILCQSAGHAEFSTKRYFVITCHPRAALPAKR